MAASQIPFKPQLHPLSLSQKIRVQNISLRGQQGLWVQHYPTSVSGFLSFPRTNCTSLRNQGAFPVITACHWHLCRKTFFWPALGPTGPAWELWLQGRAVIDFLNWEFWRSRSGSKGRCIWQLWALKDFDKTGTGRWEALWNILSWVLSLECLPISLPSRSWV